MNPLRITLTGRLDFANLRRLVSAIAPLRRAAAASRSRPFTVDLHGVTWVSPVGMAVLAAAIQDACAAKLEGEITRPTNDDVHEYLKRLDFYEAAGADGVEPYSYQRHSSAGRFCELVEVQTDDHGHKVAEAVTDVMQEQLALAEEATGAVFVALSEVTDNVFHHAKARAFVCAQTYPNKKILEVAIVDCGRGFARALANNDELVGRYRNDGEAIVLALQARITGNPSGNAGIGLFVTSELVRQNEGSMWICSGDGLVSIRSHNVVQRKNEEAWPGAIVAFRLRCDGILDLGPVYDLLGPVDSDDEIDSWIKGSR